jgi:hypothetical protein
MQPLKNPGRYKATALIILITIAMTLEVANGAVWASILGAR